ncbi:Sphingolipid c9-methyltransferase [Coniochaeta hoffmannii]|uniref:Conserved oligomeric Golgi complex subunit 1 n=1 Tax=Coniochaeta hoffmannii TaxID=91930 RepID=A0AA38RJT0_9PEZI|nr:Sphingolipid c9-methyltransferase [Coniochaeta hoffmannii]
MSSLPDLSTLSSSSEIFSNPSNTLPQIRAIHKALHAAVDDKRSRLRVQVGSSYRDLLGTADAIVAMRGDMDAVLATLGRMGSRCGRGAVGRKVASLAEFAGEEEEEKKKNMGAVGRARLVEGAALAVEGLLRRRKNGDAGGSRGGERLLAAAKLLVLSRLLVKSLGEHDVDGSVRSAVKAARKSLESSRRRLLRIVDKMLQSVGEKEEQREDVLQALAAYSLATSSGARDTLYHFIRVRGEAMKLTFELDTDERTTTADDVLRGMMLYTKTLLDVPALVPQKLTEALAALKKTPLIKDAALRSIEGLRLDIYERWCGDEIEYFTPFIRHDDLDRKQANEMLADWARKGAGVLEHGLSKTLASMTEFKAIVDLRTNVLRLWISEGGRVKGVDTSDLLDRLRSLINKHMLEVVEAKVNKLRLVGSEVSATIQSWREVTSDMPENLWDLGSLDMELTNGAAHFTQEVVSRLYGRSNVVAKAVSSYKSWYKVIDDVGQVVEQLKRQRWDNDVDEIEDEETIEQRQQLLSKDDPQALHDHLNASLLKAFKSLEEQLRSLRDSSEEADDRFEVAMYLLRVIRDIRTNLPALEPTKSFGLDLLPLLHERVAFNVADRALSFWEAKHRSRVVGRALWEGEPELPTSPSPDCFQFLRELSMSMADAGIDLWYPASLTAVKKEVNKRLRDAWLDRVTALEGGNPATTQSKKQDVVPDGETPETPEAEELNGDGDSTATAVPETKSGEHKEVLIQWLFDVSYLGCGLGLPASTQSAPQGLKELEVSLFERTKLDSHARQRISKAADEYWKRTSLLFGLLA